MMVRDADGVAAAAATGWLAGPGRCALLEPVGTLAAYGAGVYSLFRTGHETHARPMYLMDAGMILVFITLGKYLEASAKGRASSAIRKLLDLAPPMAAVERDGRIVSLPPGEVKSGETLVVRPGEKVALDALVISGNSSLDESWLLGESIPVDKGPGSEILAGTINGQGSLRARVVRTSLSQSFDGAWLVVVTISTVSPFWSW